MLLHYVEELLIFLVCSCLVFSLLSLWMPCNRGIKWWKENIWTDFSFIFLMPLVTRWVYFYMMMGASMVLYGFDLSEDDFFIFYEEGAGGVVSTQPLWLQAVLYLFLSDLYLYWVHRLFHRGFLWKFHAVHHFPKQLDWIHSFRFHPINFWLAFTLVDVLCIMIGFSPMVMVELMVLNKFYSLMVHANVNWTFGAFKYILASPVFHRWHHTRYDEGGNKNFAPTFPILDVIFGTFYMPKGVLPEHYGVDHPMPADPVGQLFYPFSR
ncbi:MAG: sterol desaturase family protein [Alphaproteobacteria bacterium]|nr:MAG: sterol desaturase family protein [Alphaproteobacteria bacterium]TAF75757.1 MAG: sterol desaturase family protein [Alphaproteobacteria bacterium]